MHVRPRHLIPAALAALCAVAPAASEAARTQESLVEDEYQMLQAGPAARERALDDAAVLGADGVRALVLWADIAPAPREGSRPAGFDPHRSRRVRRGALGCARRPGPRDRGARALAPALPLDPGPRLGIALRGLGRKAPRSAGPAAPSTGRSCARSGAAIRAATPTRTRAAACCRRCGAGRSRTSPTSRAGSVRSSRAAAGSRIRRPPSPTARWCAAASRACARAVTARDQMLLGETSPIGRDDRAARDTPGAAGRVHPHAAVHGCGRGQAAGARRPRCAAARRRGRCA